MTDRRTLSKEEPSETPAKQNEEPSDYYYDDSTGYRIYDRDEDADDEDADDDDDDDDDEQDEADEFAS
jgi:hypothetical protein